MKILLIGCGGIGSLLAQELYGLQMKRQIPSCWDFWLADDDIVEVEQIKWQNFAKEDIGENKAKALCRKMRIFKYCNYRIKSVSDLQGHDYFILCVDNEKTRELVIKYCFRNKKPFVDLRCNGRRVFAIPKMDSMKKNLKFVDSSDTASYSCQEEEDIRQGRIQLGHKYIAIRGAQMFLNYVRGYVNRPYLDTI